MAFNFGFGFDLGMRGIFADIVADIFSSGEIGDFWRFDPANTNANVLNDPITSATGLVNGRVLGEADPAGSAAVLEQPNGNWAAKFDSASDRLFHNFGATVAQPGTIILSIGGSTLDTMVFATGSSAASRWQISADSADSVIAFAGATLDSTINTPLGTKVLTAEFNGASSKFRVNGVQTATGNAGTQSTDRLTIGALYDGTFGAIVNLYSALFINRLLDPVTELDPIERLMGAHAGVSW